jgi:hypothetical protein
MVVQSKREAKKINGKAVQTKEEAMKTKEDGTNEQKGKGDY